LTDDDRDKGNPKCQIYKVLYHYALFKKKEKTQFMVRPKRKVKELWKKYIYILKNF